MNPNEYFKLRTGYHLQAVDNLIKNPNKHSKYLLKLSILNFFKDCLEFNNNCNIPHQKTKKERRKIDKNIKKSLWYKHLCKKH